MRGAVCWTQPVMSSAMITGQRLVLQVVREEGIAQPKPSAGQQGNRVQARQKVGDTVCSMWPLMSSAVMTSQRLVLQGVQAEAYWNFPGTVPVYALHSIPEIDKSVHWHMQESEEVCS